ncbi:hypothetical protein SMU80_05391 [Streptococcus mutans SF1]|nr:hypothetical protein SMU80_05391 [Streptococcus mutans SF1]EMC45890.1 hypothetical protein SMU97_00479 [Streptococcus mutans SM4]
MQILILFFLFANEASSKRDFFFDLKVDLTAFFLC